MTLRDPATYWSWYCNLAPSNHPGSCKLLAPKGKLSFFLPAIPGFSLGGNYHFANKHDGDSKSEDPWCHIDQKSWPVFQYFKWDVYSYVSCLSPWGFFHSVTDAYYQISLWPSVKTSLFLADAAAIKVQSSALRVMQMLKKNCPGSNFVPYTLS